MNTHVNWNYPQPRSGFSGAIDKFFGPGTTKAEAWLFRSMDWLYFGVMVIYLLGAALIILKIPLYLQRPIAFGALAISWLINCCVFSPTPGLEWFVPFLFFKLLVSHALREEPYRPLSGGRIQS